MGFIINKFVMKISFIIYLRALGLYSLITLPALVLPVIYMISLFYVFVYGWFAWAMFSIIYLLIVRGSIKFEVQMSILSLGVIVSVLFAFQMLEVFGAEEKIWHSGPFLLLPLAAMISGWSSLYQ